MSEIESPTHVWWTGEQSLTHVDGVWRLRATSLERASEIDHEDALAWLRKHAFAQSVRMFEQRDDEQPHDPWANDPKYDSDFYEEV